MSGSGLYQIFITSSVLPSFLPASPVSFSPKPFASNVELPKGNTTSKTVRQFSTFFFPQLLPLTKSSTSGSPLRDDHRLPRIVLVLVFTPAVETIQLSLVQAMIKIPTYHIYEVQAYFVINIVILKAITLFRVASSFFRTFSNRSASANVRSLKAGHSFVQVMECRAVFHSCSPS